MAQQAEPDRVHALFEPALRTYERKVGVSLEQHPLAVKLQSCDTVEAITCLFQDRAQAFRDIQGSDKIMVSIKTTVSILSNISSAGPLPDAPDIVR